MERRSLEVTVIAATDLKDVSLFGKMDVYVVVYLNSGNKQRTLVHKDGRTNPRWGHTLTFTVDEAAALAGLLKFKIKAKRILRNKDVGEVDVPVRELLDKGGAGDGKPKVQSYSVRLPSGDTKGVLEFSYKFGEQFTVTAPPPANKADEPVLGYPTAAAPPASNSAAAYPPPMHGALLYPQPAVYGYPPNATPKYGDPPPYPLAGYGYPAPPLAYQTPPKKSGGENFMGVVKDIGKQVFVHVISNSVNDAGYDAGFDGGF